MINHIKPKYITFMEESNEFSDHGLYKEFLDQKKSWALSHGYIFFKSGTLQRRSKRKVTGQISVGILVRGKCQEYPILWMPQLIAP